MTVPEIAIIGGGPSGLALAAILSSKNPNLSYTVYERSAPDVPPRGGCLDLHAGSGQLAMQEAGPAAYEKFREYGRGGDATFSCIYDHRGKQAFTYGEGADAPELDREQIKRALLGAIPGEKVRWRKALRAVERDEKGEVVLVFEDGSMETGFKLVVGADGVYSKVRHLVTDAKPRYAGMTMWSGTIRASNPMYPELEKMAKLGPMVILGRSTMVWVQRQGDGHYRLELGFKSTEDYHKNLPFDLSDTAAVKKMMLEEHFAGHSDEYKAIFNAIDSSFYPWPMYYMPPEELKWKASPDVTLIGDAAHVTTPFIGEGVNVAMLDSVVLARKLKEFGICERAIAEYEADMFVRATDVIKKSVRAGELDFDWDAPRSVMEANKRGDNAEGLGHTKK